MLQPQNRRPPRHNRRNSFGGRKSCSQEFIAANRGRELHPTQSEFSRPPILVRRVKIQTPRFDRLCSASVACAANRRAAASTNCRRLFRGRYTQPIFRPAHISRLPVRAGRCRGIASLSFPSSLRAALICDRTRALPSSKGIFHREKDRTLRLRRSTLLPEVHRRSKSASRDFRPRDPRSKPIFRLANTLAPLRFFPK